MDIKGIKFNDAAEMTVVHPISGEPLKHDDGSPFTITVHSVDSEKYRRAMFEARRRNVSNEGDAYEISRDQAIDLLANITECWNIVVDGDTPECTFEAARKLYTEEKWLRDQVEAFSVRRSNFLLESSATSKSSRKQNSA